MNDSIPFPQPTAVPFPSIDPTIVKDISTTDTDALWGDFNKFYNKNQKAIEKCMKTDVRSIALGEAVSDIELQIDSFSETTKVVLDGLAGLGKIHPIIGVAVVAFHAVISLDMSRRDNDRKVIAIMLEMQNMMCGMFPLRHLKYPNNYEGERDTEKSHLEQLIEGIKKDIMQCGSDLNCYLDRNRAFKLFKAKNFEQRFKTHVDNFAKRRSELQGTITVYTASVVGQASATISEVSQKLNDLEVKLDDFFEAFMRKLDTPPEKEAFRFFEQNNGVENCISKDELFGQLLTMMGDVLPDSENKAELTPDERMQMSREVLTDKNFEEALNLSTARYESLLTIQNNNNERVIAQLEKQEGYHKDTLSQLDKILYYLHHDTELNDPEVRRIWERMDLKTSVKAKTFVLTFRDHYPHDRSSPLVPNPVSPSPSVNGATGRELSPSTNLNKSSLASPSEDPNAWLLEYIDVAHVRPIVEAIDIDGSGFISVKEINTFARVRPTEWSLLQWMVYWAAGWHINITRYRNKIYDILIQMHELLPLIHPANRVFIDEYLANHSFTAIEAILRSTKPVTYNQRSQIAALAKFYADVQESALRTNLKEVSYVISSAANAKLVAGPDRAESWFYPLLYLLLERHLAVLKLGRTQVLNTCEMSTHVVSLASVLAVFEQRKESLIAIFSQIYENIAGRFETFAYGMFCAPYNRDTEMTPAKNTLLKGRSKRLIRELLLEMRNKSKELAAPPDTTILALKKGAPFEFEHLNIYESACVKTDSDPISHPLEGYWSMMCLRSNGRLVPQLGLLHFALAVAPDGSITGSGEGYAGKLLLTGTAAPFDEGSSTHSLDLKMVIDNVEINYFFHGVHNAERDVVTGPWGFENRPQASRSPARAFTMRRTPADIHQFRCDLNLDTETDSSVLAKNRWKFAIKATKFRVQIMVKNFSWEHALVRLTERRLWLDLTVAFWQNPLPNGRIDSKYALSGVCPPWQSRLYEAIALYLNRRNYKGKIGTNADCAYCSNQIVCNRYRCITCVTQNFKKHMSFCTDRPECIEKPSSISQYNFVHTASHTLLRLTSWLQPVSYSSFHALCQTRSETVKKIFRTLEENKTAKKPGKLSKSGKLRHDSPIEEPASVQPPICVCCEKEVSLPCWICVICAKDTAVCFECEAKRAKIVKYTNRLTMHSHNHHILRINDSVEVQSGEVDNVRLQRELINITTDLRSLEQKVTTHLRAASKVNGVLRRLTSDSEVIRGSQNTSGAPVMTGDAEATMGDVAQGTVNDEEDNESDISDTFGSIYSSDTDNGAPAFMPNSLPPAAPQSPGPIDAGAEASGQADAAAASLSGTAVLLIPEVDPVDQQNPTTTLPIGAKASIITPTPNNVRFFESSTSEPFRAESPPDINLSEMENGHKLVLEPGPELATVAPISRSRQFADHLTSMDSRILSLSNHIDTRFTSLETHVSSLGTHVSSLETHVPSLGTHIDARFTSLETHVSSLEAQVPSLENHIDTCFTSLGTQVSSLGTNVSSLEARVPSLEIRIDERFTSLETYVSSLGAQVPSLGTQIDARFTSLETQVSSLETYVPSLENHMDARFTSLETHTDTRISALETRLNGIEGQLGEILSLLRQSDKKPHRRFFRWGRH